MLPIDDKEMEAATWKINAQDLPANNQLKGRLETFQRMVSKGRPPEESLERIFGKDYKENKNLLLQISDNNSRSGIE